MRRSKRKWKEICKSINDHFRWFSSIFKILPGLSTLKTNPQINVSRSFRFSSINLFDDSQRNDAVDDDEDDDDDYDGAMPKVAS